MSRRIRVACDVGGTFTDSIAYDEDTQVITVSKVSTTPENRARGTVSGLKRAIALQGASGGDVSYVGHGMTTATNAISCSSVARTVRHCSISPSSDLSSWFRRTCASRRVAESAPAAKSWNR
jgi:hypothetical protein